MSQIFIAFRMTAVALMIWELREFAEIGTRQDKRKQTVDRKNEEKEELEMATGKTEYLYEMLRYLRRQSM